MKTRVSAGKFANAELVPGVAVPAEPAAATVSAFMSGLSVLPEALPAVHRSALSGLERDLARLAAV